MISFIPSLLTSFFHSFISFVASSPFPPFSRIHFNSLSSQNNKELLVLFEEIIAVYSENRRKRKMYSVGKMHNYWLLKQVVLYARGK
jgi:hypothetical protein